MKLFTDWDETITASDTTEIIAKAGYILKPHFKPEWSYCGSAYLKDLQHFNDHFGAIKHLQQYRQYQTSLRDIELAS